MRILFIANSRIPTERAMGTAIMKQCGAFVDGGVDVELVVPKRSNEITDDPFQYHHVKKTFKITYLWSLDLVWLGTYSLRFVLQKISFFIALNFYLCTSKADMLYSREPELIGPLLTNKKKFVELHHLFGLRLFGRYFVSHCTGIITLTNALKDDVIQLFGVEQKKIIVAPSGVDLSECVASATEQPTRLQLGITTKKPLAMYIGSLEAWKGYEVFLQASNLVQGIAQFIVIGGSSDQVTKLRQEYPNVLFLGFLPQQIVRSAQQIASVLVAPNSGKELISARHTSPLKIFEYMTSGVPIVASAVTSISEVLSKDNAILVTPDDPKALADGILRAIEDMQHSATIAEQAKKDVQQFDWSNRATTIISFLHERTSNTHS